MEAVNEGKTEVPDDKTNPIYKQPKGAKSLKELDPAHVKIGKLIDGGNFGVVYAGTHLSTDVAIKTFKSSVEIEDINKELKLIQ